MWQGVADGLDMLIELARPACMPVAISQIRQITTLKWSCVCITLCSMCFQVESSNLPFTAEGQLLTGHFFVNYGTLKVPDEVR